VEVDDELDLAETWTRLKETGHRYQRPAAERLLRECERVRSALEAASKQLRRVADAVQPSRPTDQRF
jgi:hypothetical protein